MNQRPLSIHEFKNWLAEQKGMSDFFNIGLDREDPCDMYEGKEVKPKVGEGKLIEKIETEDDPVQLVHEFIEEGGTILRVEEKKVFIEVESGEFSLPRFCVKIRKE